jgi:hypothetical protein
MTPRAGSRTQPCSESQARTRLQHARQFLDVSRLTAEEAGNNDFTSVAAALAVLAGIAAADAACCKALGRRSRSADHRQAADLLREVVPGGQQAASSLRRLVDLKDQAEALVTFAEDILQR